MQNAKIMQFWRAKKIVQACTTLCNSLPLVYFAEHWASLPPPVVQCSCDCWPVADRVHNSHHTSNTEDPPNTSNTEDTPNTSNTPYITVTPNHTTHITHRRHTTHITHYKHTKHILHNTWQTQKTQHLGCDAKMLKVHLRGRYVGASIEH